MKTALYYIRTRCNYSQSMVARELNVSRQIYSAWESGAKALPALRSSELANLFGVPEEILLECEEEQQQLNGFAISQYSAGYVRENKFFLSSLIESFVCFSVHRTVRGPQSIVQNL